MRAQPVRRIVALLSTMACCIALPTAAGAATDDSSTKKNGTKSTSSSKSSSTKPTKSSKSSAKTTKTSSKSTTAHSSTKKTTKATATATAKKPAAAPAPAKPPSTEAVRAAFDPVAPTAGIPGAPASTAAVPPGQRGPTRIDFDDRLIQGQRNTAGAVYLYDRKELKQRSMIKKRESFREEIVGVVYDSEL